MLGGLTDPWGHSGAVLEADFPYTASDDPCGGPYSHPHAIWSWAVVGPADGEATVEQIKQAIMDHGPVQASVRAVGAAFHAYNGGVFNACSSGWANHGIVLVGWDDNQGTEGVWILRNSWGTDWGIDGYMLIEYGCNRVGYVPIYVNYSPQDCNGNAIPDRCDVSCETPGGPCDIPGCGTRPDCNGNELPDECDITSAVSTDHNSNMVPDECEQDCNGNDVPDECDLSCAGGCTEAPGCGLSSDCQGDGLPDECQAAGGVRVPTPAPPCSPAANDSQPWCDDLEGYSLGSISGNNWEGWDGNPAALGTVTNEQNHTLGGSQSLKIQDQDTVHVFTGYHSLASAHWLLRVYVYVPSTMTGEAYFFINPDYPWEWTTSVELAMSTAAGTIGNRHGIEALPLVTDAWVEVRAEINFTNDLVTIYYDDEFLASHPWTIKGGSSAISALDLFSFDSSGVYYDDLSLYPGVSNDCNGNGVPDECDVDQTDPDGNGEVSSDENANGTPDECETSVPVMTEWGLVVMTLLILSAGTIVAKQMHRRPGRA